MEIPFLGKCGPKNQNCHFKLKFCTYTNSNMQSSMVMFIFFCFWSEIPFWGKFSSSSQNYQLQLKFGTYTNSNMQNSVMLFTFFAFEWKYPFWENLVQKVKMIGWIWNLVARLIRICRIQWWCSLFLFFCGNTFFGQIWSKNQNSHFKLKLGTSNNSNMQNSMVMFISFVFDPKYPFGANLVQKVKIMSWS